MAVKRIVPNIAVDQTDEAIAFYTDVLGLEVGMDQGWIVTLVGTGEARPQLSFATEGGSGTTVPDLSIEVDDLSDALERMVQAGYRPEYGPVSEPWGVKRFFIRDPLGKLINILQHD